ncbi:MAG: hypothetical protein J5790_07895 [Bacteroidaceae bacterium]|nr:hypothetical protein [Bacteroidaceae bacterium]
MSKVKYRVREYNPTTQNQGSHSYYAEVVINNEIDNSELAKKIAARTGFKSYECQAVIAAIADIVFEETLESNRISLSDENGTKFVSIYPRVQGSVSDLDIERETTAQHAEDPLVQIRTRAEEADLTPSRLTWNLASTVGIKFSKEFSLKKQAQKVKVTSADVTVSDDEGGSGTNQGGNGTLVDDPDGD